MIRHRSLLLIACLTLAACNATGVRIAYIRNDPSIGKRVSFIEPIAYITNLPEHFGDPEEMRINRSVMSQKEIKNLNYNSFLNFATITPIAPETTFEVIGIYRVKRGWIDRAFADDHNMTVLKDQDGKVSTILSIRMLVQDVEA